MRPGFAPDVDSGGHHSGLSDSWNPSDTYRDRRALLPGTETASSRDHDNPLDGSNIIQHEQHNTPRIQRYGSKDMLPSLPQMPLPDEWNHWAVYELTDSFFAEEDSFFAEEDSFFAEVDLFFVGEDSFFAGEEAYSTSHSRSHDTESVRRDLAQSPVPDDRGFVNYNSSSQLFKDQYIVH
jgi:hypothetical protein